MSSNLSLVTRKNIKEYESRLATHLETIAKATGITFDLEADWVSLAAFAEAAGRKDKIGEIIQDGYMNGLATNVAKFAQNSIQREAFVETFGEKHQIIFSLVDNSTIEERKSQYNWVNNKDGVLEVVIASNKGVCNPLDTGKNLAEACSGDGPISVLTRKNISDKESSRQKHIKTIADASGVEFDLDIDWLSIAPLCKATHTDRAGEIVYENYLGGLATNVVKYCKDPIQRESFVEAFGGAKTISMTIVDTIPDEHKSQYNWTNNKNGVLEIVVPATKFPTNPGNTGMDLAESCSGEGPMTVLTRKNIADKLVNLKKHLKTILDATGIEFEVDVDWPLFAEQCKVKGYANRCGDVMYENYMGGLATNITKFCKDPIQREAFCEAFGSAKSIRFTLVETVPDKYKSVYSWTKNNSGVLEAVIPLAKFVTNSGNLGMDLAEACSEEGQMSVLTRKNIADQEKNRVKNLERIQKATGIEFEVDVDWPLFTRAAEAKGYKDRIGEIIFSGYLGGLATQLEKFCKDDMVKEAIVEACTKKTIAFALVPKAEMDRPYVMTKFSPDGALVVCCAEENFNTNSGDTGKDIETRL